jgi:hypothetical protein
MSLKRIARVLRGMRTPEWRCEAAARILEPDVPGRWVDVERTGPHQRQGTILNGGSVQLSKLYWGLLHDIAVVKSGVVVPHGDVADVEPGRLHPRWSFWRAACL